VTCGGWKMARAISCSKRRVILAQPACNRKRDEWLMGRFYAELSRGNAARFARWKYKLCAGMRRRRELKEYARGVNVYITRRVAIFALKSRAENNNRSGGIGVTQAALGQENKNTRSRRTQPTTRWNCTKREGLKLCTICDFRPKLPALSAVLPIPLCGAYNCFPLKIETLWKIQRPKYFSHLFTFYLMGGKIVQIFDMVFHFQAFDSHLCLVYNS
jgi:hypothetical protein